MASGSTAARGGFDFASDDILCSYEDYGNHQPIQDPSNGSSNHSNPSKDFQKNRISRSSVMQSSSYGLPEESIGHEVIIAVERIVKIHNENLMRFLEGISSRLSQLELHCYNLDKSISEMKSDILRDHGEADNKLKSLEKHLLEVHRSVQILRDKQELADTQKELAKLQLAQKESSSNSSAKEDKTIPSSEVKKIDKQTETSNQQLALVVPPTQPQNAASQQPYYPPPNPQVQTQQPQPLYLPTDTQFRTPPLQDISRIPSLQSSPSQAPSQQQFSQYQHQWPQQVKPPSSTVYSTYLPPGQSPVQAAESASVTYAVPVHGDMSSYGYTSGRPNNTYTHQTEGYSAGSHLVPTGAYVIRQSQPSSFPQAVYATTNLPLQKPQSGSLIRNNPHNDLIEKMVNMGFRADHVVGVIQSLEENGQPVDFHAVLDRLNMHSQRGWSG